MPTTYSHRTNKPARPSHGRNRLAVCATVLTAMILPVSEALPDEPEAPVSPCSDKRMHQVVAQEPTVPRIVGAQPSRFSHALFNGQHTDQWIALNCQIAIVEENLRLQDGDGFVHTIAPYKDFILEFEWRALNETAYDSGIYFRAELPKEDQKWPRRYQVNLKQGEEGNLIGFPDAHSAGLVKDGQWNAMRLVVQGTTASLEINGEPAWSVDGVDEGAGYIGLQSEVPLGGQFDFRNIHVAELGFHSLFNGEDLSGWEQSSDNNEICWDVQDGLLRCTGRQGSWLRSENTFADFNIRLEYRLRDAGNSGVYFRVPKNGNHHGPGSGIEVQILDDDHERYRQLRDYQFSGSLYAISPATSRPTRPAGSWNHLEIDCQGHAYRVTLNGVVVVETNSDETAALDERRLEGFLGLQNHNEEVFFRNLRIGDSLQRR